MIHREAIVVDNEMSGLLSTVILRFAIVDVVTFNALPARWILVHMTLKLAKICFQTSAAKMFELMSTRQL